jgi:hypothetical protein
MTLYALNARRDCRGIRKEANAEANHPIPIGCEKAEHRFLREHGLRRGYVEDRGIEKTAKTVSQVCVPDSVACQPISPYPVRVESA